MMPHEFLHGMVLLGAVVFPVVLGGTALGDPIQYRVRNETLCRIDPRLFGQFMERASWGEIGPEGALVPGTRELQPKVLDLLRGMKIPIIRFPGGTDADYLDWRDMISNVPGRGADRPVSIGNKGHSITNRFGYDEFLTLRGDLKSEAILVVNFGEALLKKKPLQEQAQLAAGLVAYCNAEVGAKLPAGMPDWPAVRAKNGRTAPFGVKYWQIGNETWFFCDELAKLVPEAPEKHYADCVLAYARAMLAVDPNIRFIMDGDGPTLTAAELVRGQLGDKVACLVFHRYTPWGITKVTREGKDVPLETLTAADIWNAWVATPDIDDNGLAVLRNPLLDAARKEGFKVAMTEWNWNGGWWQRDVSNKAALNSSLAKGVGAAGFLHAMMRSGDVVQIGCQSMLVGNSWGIQAIWADREGKEAPRSMPTGQATLLYSQHHGERLLAMDSEGVPTYFQPFAMRRIKPGKVAFVDALATASDKAAFFHAINRHFDQPMEVRVDLAALAPFAGKARHFVLQGRLNDAPAAGEPAPIAEIVSSEVALDGDVLKLTLPPRSVSCVEIPLGR